MGLKRKDRVDRKMDSGGESRKQGKQQGRIPWGRSY